MFEYNVAYSKEKKTRAILTKVCREGVHLHHHPILIFHIGIGLDRLTEAGKTWSCARLQVSIFDMFSIAGYPS